MNPVLPVSVSVAPSANPVYIGTSVTFTSSSTNGGTLPSFQWKVNGVVVNGATNTTYVYIPVNGDAITCLLTSNITCPLNNPAISNTVTMTVNPLPFITVIAPNGGENWLTGSTHNIIWNDNITNNVKIDLYKGGIFMIQIIASTPSTGTFSWVIPANQQAGADYKVRITSTADNALYDHSNDVFTITSSIPVNSTIQNVTVNYGHDTCFNATQTLTVAGSGTSFIIQSGGSATLVAGQKISYLPGTKVYSGGYMHGYITSNNQYCYGVVPSMVTVEGEEEIHMSSPGTIFQVFPNPSSGNFTLAQSGDLYSGIIKAEIYGMRGEKVLTAELFSARNYEFKLSNKPPGLYFLKVIAGDYMETIKLVITK